MARKPLVAGQFYERDRKKLTEHISEAFMDKAFGPGGLPKKADPDKKVIAVIVPHAGYPFSAMAAAHAYKEIAEAKKPDVIVIFGTDHTGAGTCLCDEDFETPLGIQKVDSELLEILKRKLNVNNKAHEREHSIEVQIPFLQFLKLDASIVPIIIGEDFQDYELAIKEAISTSKRDVLIIASSDFTHYGFNYNYLPFTDNIKENLYELDEGAIEYIKALDSYRFAKYAEKHEATICGFYGICLLINIIKSRTKKVKLLKYYTSGDVTGDFSSAVGYASIVFE